MNRKGAVGVAVLATLLITPAVLANNNTCTVIGIEKEQVMLRCATTEGLTIKKQVELKPVKTKSLEGC
jgi:hypothetical protein